MGYTMKVKKMKQALKVHHKMVNDLHDVLRTDLGLIDKVITWVREKMRGKTLQLEESYLRTRDRAAVVVAVLLRRNSCCQFILYTSMQVRWAIFVK